MNNQQVAEAFAQEATKGTGSNLFIEGKTIYSYGYHFPIAVRSKDSHKAFFNSNGYSHSTAIHKGKVRRALEQRGFELVPATTQELQNLIRSF